MPPADSGADCPFRCGTPSAEEWNGEWRFSPQEPPVTDAEYHDAYMHFDARAAAFAKVGADDGCDFYFRGDNYGDRTQYLELINPDSLTPALLQNLQALLREPRFRSWRILIMTYLGEENTLMVYPSVVRTGRQHHDDVCAALCDIVPKLRERRERERSGG